MTTTWASRSPPVARSIVGPIWSLGTAAPSIWTGWPGTRVRTTRSGTGRAVSAVGSRRSMPAAAPTKVEATAKKINRLKTVSIIAVRSR